MNFPTIHDLGAFGAVEATDAALPTATGPTLIQPEQQYLQQTGPRVGPLRLDTAPISPSVISPIPQPAPQPAPQPVTIEPVPVIAPEPRMAVKPTQPYAPTQEYVAVRNQAYREAESASQISPYEAQALIRMAAAEREAAIQAIAERRAEQILMRARAAEAPYYPPVAPQKEESKTPWGLIAAAIMGTYVLTQ